MAIRGLRMMLIAPALVAGLWASVCSPPAVAQEVVFLSNGSNPTSLYWVDMGSNEAQFLLNFGSSDSVHAVALCPGRSTLIGIGKNPPAVVAVDLAAPVPAEVLLGELPPAFTKFVVQLACALDGTLFLTNTDTDELYTLDLLTCPICAPVLVGTLETAPGLADVDTEGADIAFTASGELFLLSNSGEKPFYSVDPNSALSTFIGNVANPDDNTGLTVLGDDRLVFSSNDDHLYEVSQADASLTDLGVLTEGGLQLDIFSGDLAAPRSICICGGGDDGGGDDDQGCTPGYWKNHADAWPPTGYSPGQSVASVFGAAAAYPGLASASLLEALSFGGGPGVEGAARNLLRAAVAALLNAAHPGVDYPRSAAQVIADADAALASGDRDTMLDLAAALDADNNLGCPLNGGGEHAGSASRHHGEEPTCRCLGPCFDVLPPEPPEPPPEA